jgi:hypothetical protein
MPIPKGQLDRIIDCVEQYLVENKQEMLDRFHADGAPQKKTDQEPRIESPWGVKPPKPPVPIMKL